MASRTGKRKDKTRAATGTHRDEAGRVHLALHQDPRTGETYVALVARVFNEAWQDNVAAATANTARDILRETPDVDRVVALARNAMAAASRISAGLLARAASDAATSGSKGAVACHAGCDHCCYQSVGVTALEAIAIVDHVKKTLSAADLTKLTDVVSQRHAQTEGLSTSERFSPEHPCPFLDAGQCSIYEVRPLACRGMNSLDAQACATRLRDPEARAAFLSHGDGGGRSYLEPIRAFHAISAGLQLSLSELYLLDMRPLELTDAIHLLLSGPASLPNDWLGGQQPFEAALRKDDSHDVTLRELSGAIDPAF